MGKQKHSILLVEDDLILQEIITLVFAELGISVRSVDSVDKVYKILSEDSYSALIIDYALFDGFGTELIPQLKAQSPQTKIIGISSFDVSQKFYEAGADLFIRKPFNIVPFAKTIKDLLDSQSTNQA